VLDEAKRTTILTLAAEGRSRHVIAEAVGVSRNTVKRVLKSGQAKPAASPRAEQAAPFAAQIAALARHCEGNLVRVHEELAAQGVKLRYSTLTAFCRRHGIGVAPKVPVGQHDFAPGEEMQHDTSPHRVKIGGVRRVVQCASLVLCHSHMLFAQVYPVWDRFWCKVFLTEALRYFGGAAARCMLDNSTVVIATGTGKNAVPAPEMAAFAERFDFAFVAHEVGDAKRSGRVERPFHYIEHNFYAGRDLRDVPDTNAQLRAWCDQKNALFRPRLRAAPVTLFALERPALRALPVHVPEVERIHVRIVDSEGFVNLHGNRYSAPVAMLSRELTVHEAAQRVRLFLGPRIVAEHPRLDDGGAARSMLPEHREERRWRHNQSAPRMLDEERLIRADSPALAAWLDAAAARGRATVRALRHAHRLWTELPREPLERAFTTATAHGLFEVARIETMALRELGETFFRLAPRDDDDPGGDDERYR
jgi:transposase